MSKAWVGIDGGKAHHWAVGLDAEGGTVLSRKVGNEQALIEQLIRDGEALADEVVWAIDLTNSCAALLLALLARHRARVVYVPGRMVNRASDGYRGEAKTDARDARVIADQARMRRDFATVAPASGVVAELTALVAHRRDLVGDRARLITRLRAHLTGIFPGLERQLDVRKRIAHVLLVRWQTPQQVRRAGERLIAARLIGYGARSGDAIAGRVVAAARAQTVAVPGQEVIAEIVADLAGQLLALDARIKRVDRALAEQVARHPSGRILLTLPGLGHVLAAEFLVAVGDVANFAGPGQLASYAGLAPVLHDSGRISGNLRKPRRYNRMLRRVFYLSAVVAANCPGESRDYYLRKRSEGKRPVQAHLALARQRVNVVWAMLRDSQPYRPTDRPEPLVAA